MPVWRAWKTSLCPSLSQDQKNASQMKEKMKLLPFCLFLEPHLLPHLISRWWASHFNQATTSSKRKGKVGKSVWEDPTSAFGRAHNIITDDELRVLSSISSHELVSHHIHKLVQVFFLATFVSYWVFTLVKVLTLLSSLGSRRILALDDRLSE